MTPLDRAQELGNGRVPALIFKFAVPSIVGMLAGALYNIVDRVFIGQGVGAMALAGVTVAFPLMLVQIAFSVLVAMGTAALISISLGEGDREKAERALGNGFSLNIAISAILAAAGLAFLDPLLRIFGASGEVLPYARSYTSVILLGTVFATISQGANGYIRAEGNPRTAMATMLIGPILNTLLCPLFIFGLGLGIAGSALATVISQAVGSVWVLSYYLSGRSLLKLRPRNLRPRGDIVRSIVSIGSATCLGDLAASLMNAIMNNQLERYGGDLAVSAMGIVFAISNLFVLTLFGVNMGVQPIIGYNLGSRQFDRVRKAAGASIAGATAFVTLGFVAIQCFPRLFVRPFAGPHAELEAAAVYALRRYFLALFLLGFQIVGSGYFQAAGKPRQSILLGLSRQVLLLIPLLYVLPLFLGLEGLWIAQPVADLVASALTAFFLLRELRRLGGGAILSRLTRPGRPPA